MSRVRLRSAWSRAASTLLFRDSYACTISSTPVSTIPETTISPPLSPILPRTSRNLPPSAFPPPLIQVRDFIHTSLYHPTDGYFTSNAAAVGSIPHPISFRQLAGRREWMALQQSLYASADTSWFTPSELFQPWYGYAVADFILSSHSPTKPLKMYEVGGGGGTLARNILDRLQAKAPAVYRHCRYTSVEISPALARRQRERITGYALKHGNAAAPDSGSQDGAALSVGRARRGAKGARDGSASRAALNGAALNGAARRSPSHESVHSVAVFDAADVCGWVGGREEGGVCRGSEGRVGEEMGDREGRGVSGVGALVHVFGTARTKRCSVFGIRCAIQRSMLHSLIRGAGQSAARQGSVEQGGQRVEKHYFRCLFSLICPCTSHAPPMHLPCTSHAPPMPLPCTSHAPPMHLPCPSHAPPMPLPCTSHAPPMHLQSIAHSPCPLPPAGCPQVVYWRPYTQLAPTPPSLLLTSLCCNTPRPLSPRFSPPPHQRLLEAIYTARPNATVIAADFSVLPDVRIPGANAPLVAAKVRQ
ncbi:unnamed protein product [Closterium sp. NIES-64]|nr:unnamed protein product [Closterium sp. NIES-64]